MNKRMLQIAKEMVEIPSINTTSGEHDIAVYIENFYRNLPYFKKHPELVFVKELKDDSYHRRNVFALLLGEKDDNKDTIILHGHTDTVGVEDYGALKEFACKPDVLKEKLKEVDLPDEVRSDLESGDYMFGRGACDMKSGDAVFMGLMEELSEHPELVSGNILVSLNPVEENLHTGVIEGLDVLEEIQKKYDLQYTLAINNDYICPLFPGDETYTVYTGVVGKLLPCFYIQGKETHVGQCFEGFDASSVAARLVTEINLNTEYSDVYDGEYSYPPSVLKMKDLKPWYNVQTPKESFVYFNYFVHNASMGEIISKLKKACDKVMLAQQDYNNQMNQIFCKASHQEMKDYLYNYHVLTYEELYQLALQKEGMNQELLDVALKNILLEERKNGTDLREIPIAMIRYLLQETGIVTPCVVLYFAPPYCPHNTLQGEDEKAIERIKQVVATIEEEYQCKYRFMKFFPSLSDSSYLKIDDTDESLELLIQSFPGFETLYPVPLKQIKRLNVKAVNFGCFGKDAHKWTERVNIPYTFGILPELLKKTMKEWRII